MKPEKILFVLAGIVIVLAIAAIVCALQGCTAEQMQAYQQGQADAVAVLKEVNAVAATTPAMPPIINPELKTETDKLIETAKENPYSTAMALWLVLQNAYLARKKLAESNVKVKK